MGNKTRVTIQAVGGAVVAVLIGTLAAFGVTPEFPPGYESAATVVATALLTWFLPESLKEKLPDAPAEEGDK